MTNEEFIKTLSKINRSNVIYIGHEPLNLENNIIQIKVGNGQTYLDALKTALKFNPTLILFDGPTDKQIRYICLKMFINTGISFYYLKKGE